MPKRNPPSEPAGSIRRRGDDALLQLARGRPALPEGEAMAPVSIYMKRSQREKLKRLGGAAWVRKKIDAAREPQE